MKSHVLVKASLNSFTSAYITDDIATHKLRLILDTLNSVIYHKELPNLTTIV